jgi:hypothetical protein
VKLCTSEDLKTLVRMTVERDGYTGPGKIFVERDNYATVAARMATLVEELKFAEDYWGSDRKFAEVAQVAVLTAYSIATQPVLRGGDNAGFALQTIALVAERNQYVFDVDGADLFFRMIFDALGADAALTISDVVDGHMADFRSVICDNLDLVNDPLTDTNIAGRRPSRYEGLTAFVAPPITGVSAAELLRYEVECDRIEETLRSLGFSDVFQPIRYSNALGQPGAAEDRYHVRRSDLDFVLQSDLVVILLVRPATGLGTIASWAERTGALQLFLTHDPAGRSPLPRSTAGEANVHVLSDDHEAALTKFVEQKYASLVSHRQSRLARVYTAAGDFNRFREAFIRAGMEAVSNSLPLWLSVARVFEVLRTVDHFVLMTQEERAEIEHALGLAIDDTGSVAVGLDAEDVRNARDYAERLHISNQELLELLEFAAVELERDRALLLTHRRRSPGWWQDLHIKLQEKLP